MSATIFNKTGKSIDIHWNDAGDLVMTGLNLNEVDLTITTSRSHDDQLNERDRLTQAGSEMFKLLSNVELKLRRREITEDALGFDQERLTATLNQWSDVNK